MSKALLDLTNAYLAVEGLLQSTVLSNETRRQLQKTLRLLDHEATIQVQKHAEQEALRRVKPGEAA